MAHNVYLYILVMAGVTYLIRMLPLALSKKEITSNYIKSFLYYVPYACLAAMTFPAILHSAEILMEYSFYHCSLFWLYLYFTILEYIPVWQT